MAQEIRKEHPENRPLSTSTLRPPRLKLKMLFAPTRVIVRSAKVNSARESVPVRTAVPSVTLSFHEAGRGALR